MVALFIGLVQKRAQLIKLTACLIVSLLIGSLWQSVNAQPETPSNRAIQDALRADQLEANAEPLGIGFRQPLIRLRLRSLVTETQRIMIPAGTRLASLGEGFADLIVGDVVQTQVEGNTESTLDLPAFSLTHQLGFPSATSVYTYVVGPVVENPGLSDLLEQIGGQQVQGQYGAQLAVWSVTAGTTIEELANQLTSPPQAVDINLARRLLEQPDPTATPLTQLTPTLTSAAEASQSGGFGTWVLILIGGVLLLALVAAAAMTLRERQPEAATVPAGQRPPPSSSAPLPASVLVTPSLLSDIDEQTHPVRDKRVGARLICRQGPLAGKAWPLPDQCLVSRGPMFWTLVPEATLSSPHAVVDTTTTPYRLKDLRSRYGTRIGDETLGASFRDLEPEEEVTLGSVPILITPGSLTIRRGTMAGNALRMETGTVVISREEIPFIVTGPADRSISDLHALLYRNEAVFMIRDLNSSNGTMVNYQRISQETPLNPGDIVTMGNCEFEIGS